MVDSWEALAGLVGVVVAFAFVPLGVGLDVFDGEGPFCAASAIVASMPSITTTARVATMLTPRSSRPRKLFVEVIVRPPSFKVVNFTANPSAALPQRAVATINSMGGARPFREGS